jgi:hypothetical protein
MDFLAVSRQPFVETSGSIASLHWVPSRKLCPIFVCQFKGSLQTYQLLSGEVI